MRSFFLRIAIWIIEDYIVDCKIKGYFVENPLYRRNLRQCVDILEIIRKEPRID